MKKFKLISNNKKGMEMVQVAILVAIAIVLGLIFKSEITEFGLYSILGYLVVSLEFQGLHKNNSINRFQKCFR